MPDFIAISLSNRVPGRTASVPAIEPLSKFGAADHSNVTAPRGWCSEATAVADLAVKYSERTARNPATAAELLAFWPQ
jgi:hypothetical protein